MEIISLLEFLVNGLLEAEENFYSNPKDLYSLEKAAKATTDAVAARFLSIMLSSMNEQIYSCSYREGRYSAQRTDQRSLISSVGNITFDCTYYKRLADDGRYGAREGNKGFMSRLAYLYEYKRETPGCKGCKERKELINAFYFGGLYPGTEGIERFWSNVAGFIG